VELKIIKTADGSNTIFSPELNEQYHSLNGAVTESEHVFINAGLNELIPKERNINILEIGMGTGLNILLTYKETLEKRIAVNYHAIEPYPLSSDLYSKLNYALQIEKQDNLFNLLHSSGWNEDIPLSAMFSLRKQKNKLEEIELIPDFYSLIYFDAFSPDIQAELWTLEIFNKIYKAVKTGGILVTYSAKGQVRRNLQQAGFIVERLPGPPGKREMLRGRSL